MENIHNGIGRFIVSADRHLHVYFRKGQDYAVFELCRMPVQLYQGNLPVPGFIGEKVRSSRRHLRRHCPEAPAEVPEDPDYGR